MFHKIFNCVGKATVARMFCLGTKNQRSNKSTTTSKNKNNNKNKNKNRKEKVKKKKKVEKIRKISLKMTTYDMVFVNSSNKILEDSRQLEKLKKSFFVYSSKRYHYNQLISKCCFNKYSLTKGAQKIRDSENAGGTSIISEAMSFEVLKKMINAKLLSTETEIVYCPEGKITDYAILVSNCENTVTLGVSVTRAMKYRGIFQKEDAIRLLEKKLFGVICSSENSSYPKFAKQILHIWSTDERTSRILNNVYHNYISNEYKHNTIVIVSTAINSDWIFWEKMAGNEL
ncbi:hypothetical protein M0813_15921 [Anaeramoeba flamelloides]|uniref:Uncharacterized protein n=1 Tax=Anaeramoeba flamelloides TaxID=1746091 RepID=A0ABQ8Z340_9EUKA|nr:hypothetical protein M0813_15921 [Anaeramoeba flamelloides]